MIPVVTTLATALPEIDPNNDHSLRALARLYRRQGQWNELIHTYDRHVAATGDRNDRVPLFHAMGGVYADELKDLDRAIDAVLDALRGRPHIFTLGHGIGQHTPIPHVERLLARLRG